MFIYIKEYKLFTYGIFTYGMFFFTFMNALANSNNLLQLLLQLFSSNSNMLANINGSNPSYNIWHIFTLNFILYNSYIFVNKILIEWLLFGELRLIEVQNINNRFVSTIINDIIMLTFFMNTSSSYEGDAHKDINGIIQQSKSNFTLNISVYLATSLSVRIIHWINLERLKMIYSKLTNENLQQSRASNDDDYNDEALTGSSLKEDMDQLKIKNFYFVVNFYRSRYFLILLALTVISIANAWKYNIPAPNSNNSMDLLSSAFRLFFTFMSINTVSTWCFSVVNLIDAYKSKCQQDNIILKLRESMRQINKTTEVDEAGNEDDSSEADSCDEDLDSDDEGIFGYNDTFEAKYRVELMISLVTDVLHVAARIAISYTNLYGISALFSNQMLSQIYTVVSISKNLMSIYKKYDQLEELPSPSELECKEDDSCIICMDSLYPTKRQLNVAMNKHKLKLEDSMIQDALIKYKPKTLPCGHFLHFNCLKSWFERSKSCPMCRMDIFDASTGKLKKQVFYRNANNSDTHIRETTPRDVEDTAENLSNEQPDITADSIDNVNVEDIDGDKHEIENNEDEQNSFEYKDLSEQKTDENYCMLNFSKHKIPHYNVEDDELTIASYKGYINDSVITMKHVMKTNAGLNKNTDNKNIEVELDTTGFIPI